MFVRALNRSSSQPREVTLASIKGIEAEAAGTTILTQDGARFYYAPHPPDMVRKALTLYTALLGGREEAQVPLPSFSPLSNLPQPQGLAVLHLDLTKERIEIVEEIASVDADGNINLDSTESTVRILSYAKTTAQQQAVESLKNPQIGQAIAGKDVYIGQWQPNDRKGKSLGKTFAVYAAPEDLTDGSGRKLVATFQDTAKRMTALRNWHGADGGSFANDAALYTALKDGSAIGKWFIPTRDLLTGTDLDGNKVQNDYLVAHKDKLGEITTSREGCGSYDYPNYYWTLSEHRVNSYNVWCARLADGDDVWDIKDNNRQSCRPCRVEALTI
jgi:hypothetical protein